MTDIPAFNYEPNSDVGESIQELLDEPPRPLQDEYAAVSQNDDDEVEFILPESHPPMCRIFIRKLICKDSHRLRSLA